MADNVKLAEFRGYVERALEGMDRDFDELQKRCASRCEKHEGCMREIELCHERLEGKVLLLNFKSKMLIMALGGLGGLSADVLLQVVKKLLVDP